MIIGWVQEKEDSGWFAILIASIFMKLKFHGLLTASTNALPPKHFQQLGSNTDHSDAVWQSYYYAVQLAAS